MNYGKCGNGKLLSEDHRILSYSSSGRPEDEIVRPEHASMSEKCQRSNVQSNLKNPILVYRGL